MSKKNLTPNQQLANHHQRMLPRYIWLTKLSLKTIRKQIGVTHECFQSHLNRTANTISITTSQKFVAWFEKVQAAHNITEAEITTKYLAFMNGPHPSLKGTTTSHPPPKEPIPAPGTMQIKLPLQPVEEVPGKPVLSKKISDIPNTLTEVTRLKVKVDTLQATIREQQRIIRQKDEIIDAYASLPPKHGGDFDSDINCT